MDKITKINLVLKDYFDLNKTVKKIPARDMMSYFVLAGVFSKDEKNGLPISILLRKLDANNQLQLIPFVFADRKSVYTKWYFQSETCSVSQIVKIQNKILKKKKIAVKKKKIKK